MPVILKNNAFSTLATAITVSDTAIVVADGSKFPALSAGEYFYATLVSPAGTTEIVKVTARVSNSLTVVRAQDGSSAASFQVGALVEMRTNAASVTDLVNEHGQYPTRAAFLAANVPPVVTRASFFVGGNTYAVVRDATGPIVQGNGQRWRPDGEVTPEHFGAVGNGVTSDTSAFGAFLAEASVNGNPATISGGVYSVSGRSMNSLMPATFTYATGLKEDLVDALYRATPKGSLYVTKSLTRPYFSVGIRQGQAAAEFNFTRDVDGLFIIDSIWDGGIVPGAEINAENFKNAADASIVIGDITGSGNNYYFSSAQVGFSFEIPFTGTELRFNHFEDTRGGAFEVFIDGLSQGNFSTWAAVASSNGKKTIARGLANTSHVAKFVFLGDDPLNAPSAGGPRGWFKFDEGSVPNTKTAYSYDGTEYEMDWRNKTLVGSKIMEFAITATEDGSGIAGDWVPSHGSRVGATVPTSQRLFIDGAEIFSDLDTFPAAPQTISDFLLEQQYTAYSTFDTLKANPLWNGILRHQYERGVMTVSHTFTTLTDVLLGNAYSTSISGRGTLFVANNGYESVVIQGPDTNARSAGYSSSVGFYNASDEGAVALSVESIVDAISIGKSWQAVEPTYLVDRPSDAKLYYRIGQSGAVIPAGEKHSAASRIFVRAPRR